MSKKLKITWVKSGINRLDVHRRTVRALGLTRLNQTVERVDNPAVRGMLRSVEHLVHVEEVQA
jgi:large subunit ribosomal protein L30